LFFSLNTSAPAVRSRISAKSFHHSFPGEGILCTRGDPGLSSIHFDPPFFVISSLLSSFFNPVIAPLSSRRRMPSLLDLPRPSSGKGSTRFCSSPLLGNTPRMTLSFFSSHLPSLGFPRSRSATFFAATRFRRRKRGVFFFPTPGAYSDSRQQRHLSAQFPAVAACSARVDAHEIRSLWPAVLPAHVATSPCSLFRNPSSKSRPPVFVRGKHKFPCSGI